MNKVQVVCVTVGIALTIGLGTLYTPYMLQDFFRTFLLGVAGAAAGLGSYDLYRRVRSRISRRR